MARCEDVVHFPEIERAAGAPFRERDMALIADDEPLPAHELLAYQRAGHAWVATDDGDEPIAYLVLDIVDESAHVEQVSVDPPCAHHRLGQALLDAAAAWAREQGLAAMTLTTFADVPWNAPYYVRLGFRVVPEQEWTPGLRRIRDHETATGLYVWPRVVMRRPIGSSTVRR